MNIFSNFQYHINTKQNNNITDDSAPMILTQCGSYGKLNKKLTQDSDPMILTQCSSMKKIDETKEENKENKFEELSKFKEFNCLQDNINKESILNYKKLLNNHKHNILYDTVINHINSGKKNLNKRSFDNIKLKPKKSNINNKENNNILFNQQNSITPMNNQKIIQNDSSKIKYTNNSRNYINRIQSNKSNNIFNSSVNIFNNNYFGGTINKNYRVETEKFKEYINKSFNKEDFPFGKKRKIFIDFNGKSNL